MPALDDRSGLLRVRLDGFLVVVRVDVAERCKARRPALTGKIEKAVREDGLFAFAMPRGSGKTALARCAALWAILYGYRPYVCTIAGSQDNARELLRPVCTFIPEEPLLLEDFPEAVYPLRCLENSSKRQLQQHIQGRLGLDSDFSMSDMLREQFMVLRLSLKEGD